MDIKISDGSVLKIGKYAKLGQKTYKYVGFENEFDSSDPALKSVRYCFSTPEPKCEVKCCEIGEGIEDAKTVETWEYNGGNTIAYSKNIVRLYFDVKNLMNYMDQNDTDDLEQWKNISAKDKTTFDMICGILNAFNTSLKEGV